MTRFYCVEDTRGPRSGFYMAKSPRALLRALAEKDGMGHDHDGKLLTALRYRITLAKVKTI